MIAFANRLIIVLVSLLAAACSNNNETMPERGHLVIGAADEPQTLDPQYGFFGQIVQATSAIIYESLFYRELDGVTIYPVLAESYRYRDPSTLEVTLKQGIKFSDGSDLDADDVVFTFNRLPNPPGASIPIKFIANLLDRVEKVDRYTVLFHLTEPVLDFPSYLADAMILSSEIGPDASPSDFNTLGAAIGTGPYRPISWKRGDAIIYEANPHYWGAKPAWEKVTLKFIPNHSARIAALLSGDIQLTNGIPAADIPRLADSENIALVGRDSNRALYFHLDIGREISPHITDKSGNPIPNPLRDLRVRQALSISLDRQLIVDKLLEGFASPANQWLAKGYMGHNATLPEITVDVDRAKQLLTEAGYPDGFKVVLHGTANLYNADVRVLQAMASMWAKIGIDVDVEALPPSIYWGRWFQKEFSISLSSYGLFSYQIIPIVRATVVSDAYDNVGQYSNAEVDALLDKIGTSPIEERDGIMQEVSRLLHDEVALIPIYHFNYLFAYQNGVLTYDPTQNLKEIQSIRAFPVKDASQGAAE